MQERTQRRHPCLPGARCPPLTLANIAPVPATPILQLCVSLFRLRESGSGRARFACKLHASLVLIRASCCTRLEYCRCRGMLAHLRLALRRMFLHCSGPRHASCTCPAVSNRNAHARARAVFTSAMFPAYLVNSSAIGTCMAFSTSGRAPPNCCMSMYTLRGSPALRKAPAERVFKSNPELSFDFEARKRNGGGAGMFDADIWPAFLSRF